MQTTAHGRSLATRHAAVAIMALAIVLMSHTVSTATSMIVCPPGALSKCIPQSGEVCVSLPIIGHDSVQCATGTWSAGQLCFSAPSGSIYEHRVIAYGGSVVETCLVSVNVRFGMPPTLTCPPDPFILEVCEPGSVCFSVPVKNAAKVSAPGASWANNVVCINVDTSGLYRTSLIATNDCGADTCLVSAHVIVGSRPIITCQQAIETTTCVLPISICAPVAVSGQDSVRTPFGVWTPNGQLCFTADTAGTYVIPVSAYNRCGASVCTVTYVVHKSDKPLIACPPAPLGGEMCEPGRVCIPLAITGADTVSVSGTSATWANGELCFSATGSGMYNFTVLAGNSCGTTECGFVYRVMIKGLPAVTCPADTIRVTTCDGNIAVPLPLSITNADSASVAGGTWVNDSLRFFAAANGNYTFGVMAFNSCGTAECSFTVAVKYAETASIECPSSIGVTTTGCPGSHICVPVVVRGALGVSTEVSMTGPGGTYTLLGPGAWVNDRLCFPNFQSFGSSYSVWFRVTAQGECNSVTCVFQVDIQIAPTSLISCPLIENNVSLCNPGTVCVPLTIRGATSVVIAGGTGTWANDKLCFFADTSGTYRHMAIATSDCGTDSCTVTTMVSIAPRPSACFTPQIGTGSSPLEVKFNNCSTPATGLKYLWLFGDGDTSVVSDPLHTYTHDGCYTVGLRVYDTCGNYSTRYDTVCVEGSHLVVPTDQWINLYCTNPTFNGVPLRPGDIVSAYDPSHVLCGMEVVRSDGSFGFMPVYRDDPSSLLDEGADVGDVISFALNGAPVFSVPAVQWTANGDRIQVCQFSTQVCRSIHLKTGWNLISWNVEYSGRIQDAIQSIRGCVDVVLGFDQRGFTYDPANEEFSTLATVDYHTGHWFLMTCDTVLEVCGLPINPNDGISIFNGWNLVSYWPQQNLAVADALASIINSVPIVYSWDDLILVWLKGGTSFNTLVELRPLFAYWVNSTSDGFLSYPGFGGGSSTKQVASAPSSAVVPSREWMSLYGKNITLDGRALASGSTIEAHSTDGTLCGSGTYDAGVLKFTPIYGHDDANATTSTYPKTGESIALKVNGSKVYPAITWTANGDRKRVENLSMSPTSVRETVPTAFALGQNYPNPFNPSTNISFSIPTNARVQIDIFNVAGQRVRTLVDRSFDAGEHTVQWDATDASGKSVAGGMYFYRLTSGEFVQSRKMMLLK